VRETWGRYPGFRYPTCTGATGTVYYNTASTASDSVGAALSRTGTIAAASTPTSAAQVYALYTYLGAQTVVQVDHPAVPNGLTLSYGTGGSYVGFDQFGRVIDQNWLKVAGAVDRYRYGYDSASNRTWRENKVAHDASAALDQFYT